MFPKWIEPFCKVILEQEFLMGLKLIKLTHVVKMEYLLFVGISQSLFAGAVILTQAHKKLHEFVLGFWLLVIGVQMLMALLRLYFPHNVLFHYDSVFLATLHGPLLYFYTQFITSENPSFSRKDIFHLIPWFVFSIIFIGTSNDPALMRPEYAELKNKSRIILSFVGISLIILNVIYAYRTFKILRDYKAQFVNYFSTRSDLNNLRWLSFITWLSICFPFFIFYGDLLYRFGVDKESGVPMHSVLTVLAFTMGYFGYKQPVLFQKNIKVDINDVEIQENKKYKKSGLKLQELNSIMKTIDDYMLSSKAYLDYEFTIHKLSNIIDIPHYHISQTINEVKEKNFYTYINEFRIDEIKLRINDPQYNHLTLLAIGYDCGFNSKSTFNTVFKKIEGVTPSEYKKNL